MLTAEDPAMAARAGIILWGSLLLSLLTTWLVCRALNSPTPRSHSGAAPRTAMLPFLTETEWTFSGSWATNITLVGALLGTVLASVELESTVYLEKNAYLGFNLLFGAITVVAPLLYIVFSTGSQPRDNVRSFLAAGALTLGAVIGQVATLVYLEWELARNGRFPPGGAQLLWVVLVGGITLAVLYCGKTMYSILSKPVAASTTVSIPL